MNQQGQQPKYVQIARELVDQIQQMPTGTRCAGVNAIAKRWGVARATAERVLRHLAKEGYVRQVPGSGTFVAERRTRRVGIVAPPGDTANSPLARSVLEFKARLVDLLRRLLREQGHEVAVFHRSENDPFQEAELADVDLLVTVGVASNLCLENLWRYGRPLIVVGYTPFSLPIDFVFPSTVRSGYVATRALFEAGARDVWYVAPKTMPPIGRIMCQSNLAGYHVAYQDLGRIDADEHVLISDNPDDLRDLVSRLPRGSAAVVTLDNTTGGSLLEIARRQRIRVPEELAILVAGGREPCQVTCLAIPDEQAAALAVNLIVTRLRQPDTPPRDVLISPAPVDAGTIPPAALAYLRHALPSAESSWTRPRQG